MWLNLRKEKDKKKKKPIKLLGHFQPQKLYWTRTDIGNWTRPVGENHIFLEPMLVSLRYKNPDKTIERGALLPPPSNPGSYLLSCNKDFACLLPVCLWSSFFSIFKPSGCVNKSPDSGISRVFQVKDIQFLCLNKAPLRGHSLTHWGALRTIYTH